MADINDLEKRIAQIEERNRRVEGDKAWETSGFRKIAISLTTYVIAVLVLFAINNEKPWFNGLIPAIGYLLSTLSLPFIKNRWISKKYGN